MKRSRLTRVCAASALLAACIAPFAIAQSTDEHDHSHGAASAPESAPAKPAPAAQATAKHKDAGNSKMDMKAMCDMHKDMMSSASPTERQAIMDQKMKGVSPAEKQKRMKMMDEHCK